MVGKGLRIWDRPAERRGDVTARCDTLQAAASMLPRSSRAARAIEGVSFEKLQTRVSQKFVKKIRQKSILPPPTITKVWFSSYNYKTGYFTSLNFSNRPFYLPRAVLKAVCYSNRSFVFFFFKKISVESLKNHSKSQKNHKIENPILLDST